MTSGRGRWSSVAVAAVLAAASSARAEPEVVELRYAAPAGCPSRDVFEAAILERTPSVRFAAPARRMFSITIEAAVDGFRGALVVDRIADKQLAAPRCEDLATALALVTALAIDPSATAVRRPSAALAPPVPAPVARTFEVDVAAMVEAGVGPEALFAAVVEGRASLARTYQLELAAIAGRDSTARDGARARFTWLAARLGGCRRWRWRPIAIDGCGHAEAGAVRAHGEMIVNQRDVTRLWLAAGLHIGARTPLGAHGFALLQLGASLPVVRDHYIFAPDVAIHETPSVTGWVVVGVGLQFL